MSTPNASGIILLPLALAWVAWLVLGAQDAWARRRAVPARTWAVFGACFVVALALRLAAPAVPHDLNPRIDEVFLPWTHVGWRYTHGLVAWMRVVWAVGLPVDDHTVFMLVALAGALSVPLVAVVTRGLGGGRLAAILAAVVLGGLGLHVRYSHTDAPQIVEILLTWVAIAVAMRSGARPAVREVLWIGLSFGLAATMRPEAIAVPVLLGAWALACGGAWPRRTTLAVAFVVAAVALPDLLGVMLWEGGPAGRGAGLEEGHGLWTWGLAHLVPFNAAFVPAGLGVLALLAPWGRPGARRGVATLLLMVAIGSLVPNRWWSIGSVPSWCLARHQLRVLPWMALLIGLGAEAVVDRIARVTPSSVTTAARALAVLAVTGLTAATLPDAYARFTLAEEYAFIRAHLDEVPANCTIVTEREVTDHGLLLPNGLASLTTRHVWIGLADPLPVQGCVVYYRSGTCTAVEPHEPADRCRAFEDAHTLTPLAEAEIVARGWLWERYAAPTLRVGYYRVLTD